MSGVGAEFCDDERLETLIGCHANAFAAFRRGAGRGALRQRQDGRSEAKCLRLGVHASIRASSTTPDTWASCQRPVVLLPRVDSGRQARRPIFTSLPAKGDGPEPRIGVEPARQSAVDLKKRLLPRVSFPVRSAGSIVGGVIICLH